MKALIATHLLNILSLISFGQSDGNTKVLHFLSACPDMRLDYSTYLTIFYKYQTDSLIAIDTLNSGKTMIMKRVMNYPFLNKMFIQEENYKNFEENKAYFIDLTLMKMNNNKIPFDQVYYKPTAFSKPMFSVVLGTNHSEELIFKTLTESFESNEIKVNDFQNFICSGYVGSPVKNGDVFGLVYDTLDSKIKIAKTRKVENRPIFNYQMKDYFVEPKGRYISAVVKNDKWVVLDIKPKGKENLTTYHIQSINKDYEHRLDVEGDQTRARGFSNWLVGSIAESNPEGEGFRYSPGKKFRKQEPDAYGAPYDIMTKVLEIYYPGKLYLYHMPSRNYIEWNTLENGEPQGDSEVLLINAETVYYRINDKIFYAKIIDNEKLGEPNLLVQDERIRDIHWAFFGGE